MLAHEHFEELCALAAGGELSQSETDELVAHLDGCSHCRRLLAEFKTVLRQGLPFAAGGVRSTLASLTVPGDGYLDRFLTRARRDGIELPPRETMTPTVIAPPKRIGWPLALAFCVSLVIGILGAFLVGRGTVRPDTMTASQPTDTLIATARAEAASLKLEREHLQAALESQREIDASHVLQIAELQRQKAASEQHIHQSEALLSESRASDDKSAMVTQLEQQLQENSMLLAAARADADEARNAHSLLEAELVEKRIQLNELWQQLKDQEASLELDRRLASESRDIRELMGARDLHIVDVHDFDSTGKQRQAFGRIFYTRGTSLIFYAFDLNEKKVLNAKASFQAWGESLGQEHSVRSLGILYVDDQKQRRWVLKVDDPNLLKEIDTVFVTLEAHNGAKQPSGGPLLHAFLGSQPNHP